MRRRTLLAGAAALASTGVLSGRASGQSLQTIRVVTRQNEAVTPLYYAIKSGLFQRAGLDVQTTASNSGSASTATRKR